MGQAKRDRTTASNEGIVKQFLAESITDRIIDVQTKQLVEAGAIIPMDPADCERLKVLL